MRTELTVQQLLRLRGLTEAGWRVFAAFLKDKGSCEYKPDMLPLRELRLIKVIGGRAYASFAINGVKPSLATPQVLGKRTAEDSMAAYISAYRRLSKVRTITPRDLAVLKRFRNTLSITEFTSLLANSANMDLDDLWMRRKKISAAVDPYSELD